MSSETVGNLKEVIDFVCEMKDRSVTSLTEYTKKTLISSRAYIEDSIVREDGMLPIMKFVNHLLGGFVFTAVGLSNMVAGGRTVRDMAAMISTEDFHQFLDVIKEKFGDKNVKVIAGMEDVIQIARDVKDNLEDDDTEKGSDKGNSAKETELEQALFTGRLVEVKIADGKGGSVPLYFYVQLAPFTTPTNVLEEFISKNFPPSMSSRWAKFKAGEISFWKDFIFESDLVAKRAKALKADKEGILREMEDRKKTQITKAAAAMAPIAKRNHNSASSIIVISRRTIDRIMKDEGLDYRRYDTRQKIMSGCMAMMLVVFDPNYETVDIYFNGLQNPGKYSVEQIKESVGKGSKDTVDMKTLMTMFTAGQAPRF